MIGEKFVYKNKTYTIKKDVSFGEFRRISKLENNLILLQDEFENSTDEDKIKLTKKMTELTDERLEMTADFLENVLGLKDTDFNKLSFSDAIGLFHEAFLTSTTVKKKSEKTLDSQSS